MLTNDQEIKLQQPRLLELFREVVEISTVKPMTILSILSLSNSTFHQGEQRTNILNLTAGNESQIMLGDVNEIQ